MIKSNVRETISLYQSGKSCIYISKKLGFSCSKQIKKILVSENIEIRTRAEQLRLSHKPRPKIKFYYCECGNQKSREHIDKCRKCYKKASKGENNPSYKNGKPRCSECNIILSSYSSQRCKKCISNIKGEEHWNWKGGKSTRILNSHKYKLWRKLVFKRDEFQCVSCKTNKNIEAHHIIYWSESKALRFNINNGITLCRKHHKEIHDKNGWKARKNIDLNQLLSVFPYSYGK